MGARIQTREPRKAGLVFIADRLSKADKKGALYIVFFDIKTRQVLPSKRQIHSPGRYGLRNYWFNVIKQADSTLGKYR